MFIIEQQVRVFLIGNYNCLKKCTSKIFIFIPKQSNFPLYSVK